MRRLHGYALSADKSDYTSRVPGDARLFAGPRAAAPSTSGPDTALAPLAAARAGLGPPVPGSGDPPAGHLDAGGLRAAIALLAPGGRGVLGEEDRGAVLGEEKGKGGGAKERER